MSNLTYDRQSQTLECLTFGGPPTDFIWSKDNVQIDLLSSKKYIATQEVINLMTAMYTNKLIISDKSKADSGSYKCEVVNALNRDSAQLTISGNDYLHIVPCIIIVPCIKALIFI